MKVIATDAEPAWSPACSVADKSYEVPKAPAPGFVETLLKICVADRVSLVVPCLDEELLPLSEARPRFEAMGTQIAVSNTEVVRITRDKLATARALSAAGVEVPHTLPLHEFMDEPGRLTWPVIAKPLGGTSSVGVIKPRRPQDLSQMRERDGYIVQEMWRGSEYTVNVYFDQAGSLRCAIPHRRVEVRGGVVSKAITERVPILEDAAKKLAAALNGARGPMCFQAIVAKSGAAAVFEVNARFGGGYPLAHRAGARFPRWMLEELVGGSCSARVSWRAGLTMLCYDSAIFLTP